MVQSDRKFGYRWRAYAKNISRDDGRPSPGTTFKAWMRSSSHTSNILDRRLDEVGVGAATGHVNGSRTTAWTLDLRTRPWLKSPRATIYVKKF
jgi:uncharacterized protein YkwD